MAPPDIRNFFSVKTKPAAPASKAPAPVPAKPKRKVISSDDDEVVPQTPGKRLKVGHSKTTEKKRPIIIDSDDEDDVNPRPKTSTKPKSSKSKAIQPKEVNVANVFSKSPVKRVEKEVKTAATLKIPSDDEFETSICKLTEVDKTANEIKETAESPKKSTHKTIPTANRSDKKAKKSPRKPDTSELSPKNKKGSSSKTNGVDVIVENTPQKEGHSQSIATENGDRTSKSKKTSQKSPSLDDKPKKPKSSPVLKKEPLQKETVDLETSVQLDEERHEKRHLQSILFQKYKNRASVINPGSKAIPEGKPNCLVGKTFLVTGILESLERAEAEDLIKQYGGKILSGVTKKLNYMVVGEEAGPAKLSKASDLGVEQLSEDNLLDLIRASLEGNESLGTAQKPTVKIENSTVKKVKGEENSQNEEFQNFVVKKKPKLEEVEPQPGPSTAITTAVHTATSSIDSANLAWVDKYKPTSIKQIIGQQGAASNSVKLLNWLRSWYSNHDGKKKLQKPNPWAKNDDGSYFRAALLSGPPGVGKTTTATLVCQELGYDTVEFNASDTRSKKLLKEHVSELLKNKSLFGYFHGDKEVSSKHVLLMDEVDGMAGNEDRGGMQELIGLIKESSIPVICMCNDRNHQKMRSLVNYCYDLRFPRPRIEQIKGAMMSVCFREKMQVNPKVVEEIISASNNDIRQTLNYLAMLSAGKEMASQKVDPKSDNAMETSKKDLKIGPWEVVRKVFSADEHKKMTMNDKSDLFFQDYSMGPLFVHENYLHVNPNCSRTDVLTRVAKAASSMSRGDLVERRIRSNNNWSILPVQAMFSSVIPGEFMSGHITGQINFPGWLGKNSKRTKRSRLAQEIHDHTRVETSGSRTSIRMEYAPFLLDAIVRPLVADKIDGVPKALEVMKEYRLTREDIDSLVELSVWPGKKNPMDAVESKVKAALTRAYNKEIVAFSHSVKKSKKATADDDAAADEYLVDEDDRVLSEEEQDDDNLENDALIKQKKSSKAKVLAKDNVKPEKPKIEKKQKKPASSNK